MQYESLKKQRSGNYSAIIRPSEPEGIFLAHTPRLLFRVGSLALIHGISEENAIQIQGALDDRTLASYICENPQQMGEFLVSTYGTLYPIDRGYPQRFTKKLWEYGPRKQN
jgi:hypothetical protein